MKNDSHIRLVLQTSTVFVFVTGLFSLISRLNMFIGTKGIEINLSHFLKRNGLWFFVVTAVVLALCFYLKSIGVKGCKEILNDPLVCLISGMLIIVQGFISFSSLLSISIMSINSALDAYHMVRANANGILMQSVLSNSLALLALILQMIAGFCLLRLYIKSNHKEN